MMRYFLYNRQRSYENYKRALHMLALATAHFVEKKCPMLGWLMLAPSPVSFDPSGCHDCKVNGYRKDWLRARRFGLLSGQSSSLL